MNSPVPQPDHEAQNQAIATTWPARLTHEQPFIVACFHQLYA
jgi:hypothetical protein